MEPSERRKASELSGTYRMLVGGYGATLIPSWTESVSSVMVSIGEYMLLGSRDCSLLLRPESWCAGSPRRTFQNAQ